ncbi:MAG: AMP-binding protein [Thermodesulfobacteriota bacterium]|nr:AMP-binding protein [Thermodesulfobacteriota bacterium]
MEKIWMKNWPAGISEKLVYQLGRKPIFKYLRYHARTQPQKAAINYYGAEISYSELDAFTDRLAAYLAKNNVQKGDRVALFMQNCPQYVISQIAAHKAGAIVVPCSPMFKAWELETGVNDTKAKVIICIDQVYPVVKEVRKKSSLEKVLVTSYADFLPPKPIIPIHESMQEPKRKFPDTVELMEILKTEGPPYKSPEISMEDVALLQFTGGTTGLPKGAMLTHGNQLFKSAANAQVYKYVPEDIMLTSMPIYHIAGMLWGMTSPLYVGCTMAILTRFDARATAMAISALKCTKMYSTVPMNMDILTLPDIGNYDLGSLGINPCTSFGVFLNEKLVEDWGKATRGGIIVEAAYGLSETHTCDTFSPLDKPRIGSVGIPIYETDLKIVDFDDPEKELGVGQVGEITVKSPAVFQGYWEKPAETKNALRDGRVYTGDMGKYDEDGYVYFLGRKKEMIKASGYNIAPEEVEGFLMRHPAVEQAACIPVADSKRGETVKAFVVLRPDFAGKITEEELIDWSKDKMAAYKYPRFIEFRKDLPKNTIGKLLRRVLREEEKEKG